MYIEKTEISMVAGSCCSSISHMPITELENDLESIWVKVFANETSHFVASEEYQLF